MSLELLLITLTLAAVCQLNFVLEIIILRLFPETFIFSLDTTFNVFHTIFQGKLKVSKAYSIHFCYLLNYNFVPTTEIKEEYLLLSTKLRYPKYNDQNRSSDMSYLRPLSGDPN